MGAALARRSGVMHRRPVSAAAPARASGTLAAHSTADLATRAVDAGGAPLSASSQHFFEHRFGHNFADVRVHVDPVAAQSIGARAYAFGRHLVFDDGEYAPDTESGRRLLAHELTHVVQNASPAAAGPPRIHRQPGAHAEDADAPGANKLCRVRADSPKLVLPTNNLLALPEGTTVRVVAPIVTDMNKIAWARVSVVAPGDASLDHVGGTMQARGLEKCEDAPPASHESEKKSPASDAVDADTKELTRAFDQAKDVEKLLEPSVVGGSVDYTPAFQLLSMMDTGEMLHVVEQISTANRSALKDNVTSAPKPDQMRISVVLHLVEFAKGGGTMPDDEAQLLGKGVSALSDADQQTCLSYVRGKIAAAPGSEAATQNEGALAMLQSEMDRRARKAWPKRRPRCTSASSRRRGSTSRWDRRASRERAA